MRQMNVDRCLIILLLVTGWHAWGRLDDHVEAIMWLNGRWRDSNE